MCQIWIKPKGIMLPRVFWDAINNYNQEGLGVYNIDKDFIFKTEDYEKGWEYIQENLDDQMIVHHRLATSGACSLDQLHGWDMGNGHVFFHNGVLRSYHGTAVLSDTQEFVQEWQGAPLKPMIKYLEQVETSSRFVLVNRETKEIHLPDCAKWNPVFIEELGMTIQFSNDYAFSYSMLPARYGRWDAVGKGSKTRSGVTSKKPFKSVFETEKLSYLAVPYAPDTACKHGAIKMYQYADTQYQSLSEHRARHTASQGYNYSRGYAMRNVSEPTELYLNSVYNIAGTNNWVLGSYMHKLLSKTAKWSERRVINASKAYTANDLITCGDKDLARAYLLVTRERGNFKSYTTSVTPFIAGYERGIGERVKPLSLVDLYALSEIAYKVLSTDKTVQMGDQYISAFVSTIANLMDSYTGTLSDEQKQGFKATMQETYQRLVEEARKAKELEAERLRRMPKGKTTTKWNADDFALYGYDQYSYGHTTRLSAVAKSAVSATQPQAMRTVMQGVADEHDEQTVYELVKEYNAMNGTSYVFDSGIACEVALFLNSGESIIDYVQGAFVDDMLPIETLTCACIAVDITWEDMQEIADALSVGYTELWTMLLPQ